MRAIVFNAPSDLSLTEVDDPRPGPGDVVVKTAAVGICGTDTHVFDGEFDGTVYPLIPGHEATGTVVETGVQVTDLAAGDKVAINPSTTCGRCEFCLNGRSNLCPSWNGLGVVASDGASAEYVRAPRANVFTLRPDTDLHQAALIEPLACSIRGYDLQPRRMGDHYLIYGAGTMGLLMAQLAPRAGAAGVTVVDPNAARLQAARAVGVPTTLASADEADRAEWDVVIDCTGVIAAIEDGLARVKPGGTFQQFGVAPAEAMARYSPFRVYRNEINIIGTMAVLNSFGRAVDMFEAGAIDPAAMISHAFTLDDYSSALEVFRAGTGRKLQIRPNDSQSQVLIP